LKERLAWGEDYADTGLVFTRENGEPLHPDMVTENFERLAFAAGLPRVPLHGLRHGHPSYALAAGVDISVVQKRPGHSTSTLTRDTYTTVLDDLAREAADTVAAMIPRKGRRSPTARTAGHPSDTLRAVGGVASESADEYCQVRDL
jgi:integrase